VDVTVSIASIYPRPQSAAIEGGRVIRRIVVSEFMTLDGVMEAPGDEEHADGKNRWALRLADEEMHRYKVAELEEVDALLLGRTTYQIWASFWPSAPRDEGFADRINAIPKFVFSRTLKRVDWKNATLLQGDVAEEVRRLKEGSGGGILVPGSGDLVNTIIDYDLVDEYRVAVFPVLLGSGKRLFRSRAPIRHLRLRESHTFSSGVVMLSYEPAGAAPTSRFVDTFSWTNEQIRSMDAAQNIDRVLATVLFTDIVDSTGRAAALGDREWRRLLDRHDRAAMSEVERFHGRFVKSTGDGVLAIFDAPTRALRCAFGLMDAVADLELRIRAAVHTGEIEMLDGDVGGIGVHIASRVLGEAGEHRVVVTRTVRDLATGTDLVFEPLGSASLRGLPGEWELFEARTA
jgi:class 3 adenylate cyclase/dihydrofolate reductase